MILWKWKRRKNDETNSVSYSLIMIFNPEISIDDTCLKINREKC